MSEPVAVIDLGSNSIKLLVARLESDGAIEELFIETIEKRISEGISKELPYLSRDSMLAAIEAVSDLVRLTKKFTPSKTAIVATSAVRDAINGNDLLDAIKEATGLTMQILSGSEEANYIAKGLRCDPQLKGTNDLFQADLGGGSLELIRFANGRTDQAISMRLGAVRMTERFVPDPSISIDSSVETAISAFVTAELAQSDFNFSPDSAPLILTGGAPAITRSVLAAKAGHDVDDFKSILRYTELEALKEELCRLPIEERAKLPQLPRQRADILPTALITILALLRHTSRDSVTHSSYNLRYGIAAKLLGKA